MNEDIISRVTLFASLPRHEIEHLDRSLSAREFPENALLFREGTYGDVFYILLDGEVEIIKAMGTESERLLGVRGKGALIGEMSLFSREGLRTASVRARTPLRVLEMARADYDALLFRQPALAYEMARILSQRLQESEALTIRDLQDKNRQLSIAYEDLRAAQAQIIEKEKLERELHVASRIQMGLLPEILPQLPGYGFGAQIVPMSSVGGDFYDFIPLDDHLLGIAIGDVSGHGVPAALFMALTVTLLRAEACHNCIPQEVLQSVNRQLLGLNKEGMFVTVLYGVLDATTGTFTYARAGHEPPIFCSASGDLTVPKLGPGRVLGLFDDLPLTEYALHLVEGGTLVLYTDGVTEAVDRQQELYGEQRLGQAVYANRTVSAQAVCERIVQSVAAHSGTLGQHDDVTVVTVQVQG